MTAPEKGGRILHVDPAGRRRTTAWIGMVIFLAAWVMMFGSLFFAYALIRTSNPVWPPAGYAPLPLAWPALNTALLLLSSWTIQRGYSEVRRGEALLPWLCATLFLGLVFLNLQWMVWTDLWATGFHLSSGTYGSVFYTFTGFHAIHVFVGFGFLIWLIVGAQRGRFTQHNSSPVLLTAMYWHFVDVVWVLLFLTLYVL